MLPALHGAAVARSGRPGLGREAVQQRLHSSAAQPQCSMKEPPAAPHVPLGVKAAQKQASGVKIDKSGHGRFYAK